MVYPGIVLALRAEQGHEVDRRCPRQQHLDEEPDPTVYGTRADAEARRALTHVAAGEGNVPSLEGD
jgi:hypothetical protein